MNKAKKEEEGGGSGGKGGYADYTHTTCLS
jgi:hypothetical protein